MAKESQTTEKTGEEIGTVGGVGLLLFGVAVVALLGYWQYGGDSDAEQAQSAVATARAEIVDFTTDIVEQPDPANYPQAFTEQTFADAPAQQAVAQYLAAWQDRDWSGMAEHSQASWRAAEGDAPHFFDNWYQSIELLGAEILSSEPANTSFGNMRDVTMRLSYAYPPIVRTETTSARVINEDGWGVNPNSFVLKGMRGITVDARQAAREQ